MLRETLLALLALGVFCLNLNTASVTVAENLGAQAVVQTISLCGDSTDGGDASHLVCHACRPNLPAVPPPPEMAVDACLGAVPVVYAPYITAVGSRPRQAGPGPRGPPSVI